MFRRVGPIKLLLVVVQESQAYKVVAGCCTRESGRPIKLLLVVVQESQAYNVVAGCCSGESGQAAASDRPVSPSAVLQGPASPPGDKEQKRAALKRRPGEEDEIISDHVNSLVPGFELLC